LAADSFLRDVTFSIDDFSLTIISFVFDHFLFKEEFNVDAATSETDLNCLKCFQGDLFQLGWP
jgi:hypothetical protein